MPLPNLLAYGVACRRPLLPPLAACHRLVFVLLGLAGSTACAQIAEETPREQRPPRN